MKTEKAIEIVEAYQLWRRDNNVPSEYKQPEPTELGKAIDKLIWQAKNDKEIIKDCLELLRRYNHAFSYSVDVSILADEIETYLNSKEDESRTN